MSWWIYLGIGAVILLIVLVLTGRKSVHDEITVDAPVETVWSVITDTDQYEAWNPVMLLLDGNIAPGQKVTYRFTQDENNTSEISSTVQEVDENALLNQKGGLPMILTFDHKYILEATDTQTKVIIHEDYRGIGVNFWNPSGVHEAYVRLNRAIKARAESRQRK